MFHGHVRIEQTSNGTPLPVIELIGPNGEQHFVAFPYVRAGAERLKVFVRHTEECLPQGKEYQYLKVGDHYVAVAEWYGMLSESDLLVAHSHENATKRTLDLLEPNLPSVVSG